MSKCGGEFKLLHYVSVLFKWVYESVVFLKCNFQELSHMPKENPIKIIFLFCFLLQFGDQCLPYNAEEAEARVSRVQSILLLHSEVKDYLGYIRLCQKQKQKEAKFSQRRACLYVSSLLTRIIQDDSCLILSFQATKVENECLSRKNRNSL